MVNRSFALHCPNEEATEALGRRIAALSPRSALFFLYGNLGAGKTTFSRGFLRGKGFEGIVKSPTYTIVEPYHFSSLDIYHFDFYRLNNPLELQAIGIEDYFLTDAICLIEWPEKGSGSIPTPDLSFYMEPEGEGRLIRIVSSSTLGLSILERLNDEN